MIDVDLPCAHCGCILRGLEDTDPCPECGTPAGESLADRPLLQADPLWLGRLGTACTLHVVGAVLLLGAAGLDTLPLASTFEVPPWLSPGMPFTGLAWLLYLLAAWLLASPSPAAMSQPLRWVAHAMRFSCIASALLYAILNGLPVFSPAHQTLEPVTALVSAGLLCLFYARAAQLGHLARNPAVTRHAVPVSVAAALFVVLPQMQALLNLMNVNRAPIPPALPVLVAAVYAFYAQRIVRRLGRTLRLLATQSLQANRPATLLTGDPPVLALDLRCLNCQYNLRGLPTAAACPECGTPIARTLRIVPLERSDPLWINRLSVGAFIALILEILRMPQVALNIDFTFYPFGGFPLLRLLNATTLGTVALTIVATWILSTREPQPARDRQAHFWAVMLRIVSLVFMLGLPLPLDRLLAEAGWPWWLALVVAGQDDFLAATMLCLLARRLGQLGGNRSLVRCAGWALAITVLGLFLLILAREMPLTPPLFYLLQLSDIAERLLLAIMAWRLFRMLQATARRAAMMPAAS